MRHSKGIQVKLKNSEDGYILLVGMMILLALTLMGLAATRSTTIELKIVGNERQSSQRFYVADSSWQIGGLWLKKRATPPTIKNMTLKSGDTVIDETEKYYALVRNFGDGADGVLNDTFPADTEDGSYQNINFWYRLSGHGDPGKAEGFGKNYGDYKYGVEASADGAVVVATRMYKVYKHGY